MDEGLLDGIEGEDSSANAITISSEDPDVTPVDGGEEETAGSSYFTPPISTPHRKRKSADTQAQDRDLEMLEAIKCTLSSLTESAAVKQQDHITSYCQYLEHELRPMEQLHPRYFRFVQCEIGWLIYNPRSPNHPYGPSEG